MPLMPILPKTNWEIKFPPKCPLDNISFIQHPKFAKIKEQLQPMGFGYDLIEEGHRARKKKIMEL